MLDVAGGASGIEGRGHSAVRAMKRKRLSDGAPWQKYELFPAPPWATRSFFAHVVPIVAGAWLDRGLVISEPAAGLGHMSEVIAEYCDNVFASDIYRYPVARPALPPKIEIADFLVEDWRGPASDWIMTNPPFGTSSLFLDRALQRARHGVALFQRTQWLEGQTRYRDVYVPRPPSLIAPFVERVPICEGGWDPRCSTATWYTWFVWMRDKDGRWPPPLRAGAVLPTFLIPPGRRDALTRSSDVALAERCVPGFVPPSQRKLKRPKPFDWGAARWLGPSRSPAFIEAASSPRLPELCTEE